MSAAPMTGPNWSWMAPPSRRLPAFVLSLAILAGVISFAPLYWVSMAALVIALSLGLLVQPALGLALVALAIPWGDRLVPLSMRGAGIVDLLVVAVLIAWLARGVAQRRIWVRLPSLAWPLLAFLWLAGASLTQAASWQDALPEWLKWAEFVLLYAVGIQVLSPRASRVLVGALLLTGVSQAALGAYQFVRQAGPEGFILMGGFMRAYGTLNQPNPYAGYLGYLTPIAASLTMMCAGRWWRTKEPRQLAVGILSLCGTAALSAGIFMSWSRGAWLGIAASLLVVVCLSSRRATVIALSAVLAVLFVVVVFGTSWFPDAIGSRVGDLGSYVGGPDPARMEITDENFSVLERLAHWRAGLRMFEAHPWLGVGIGNYAAAYEGYALPHWYDPLGHAHNVFINFLAETGILGSVAFLIFWLAVPWTGAQHLGRGQPGWSTALAAGLVGTWVYLTVHSVFDNLFVQHLQLQLALLLAALPVDRQSLSAK